MLILTQNINDKYLKRALRIYNYYIVNSYSTALTSFPSGLTFNISDGNSLTLTQSQLDQLDARIDGVVVVSDTSSGIGNLLNNAIPTSVQQITPVDSQIYLPSP